MACSFTSSVRRWRLAPVAVVAALICAAPEADAQITFADVSTAAGITSKSVSYGASWGDVNGDGHPDLFLNNHARKHSIYPNNGSGIYTNAIDSLDPEHYWTGAGAVEDAHEELGLDEAIHGESAYVEVDIAVIRPGQPL